MLNKIMQAIGRRRIHASISNDAPLNNRNKTIYDKLKTLPFKSLVKSIECKLLLKTLSDLDCFTVSESEFQQSIDLQKNDDKTQLGRLNGFMRIDEDERDEREG